MANSNTRVEPTKLKAFHWRVVFTAGMGFFTDAYDLFIIGVVTTMLMPLWHLSLGQLALLNGAALAAAAFGAVFFGFLSDRFGRMRLYGVEVLILFFGAIMAALSPSYGWLLFARILVGFGIGGDYPSSAVIASEYAPDSKRGFLVLLVFAMQAVGLVVGPLLASLLLLTSIPHEIIWRILLGIGAIPAASVFYLRRKIKETPQFMVTKEAPVEVSRVVCDLTGGTEQVVDAPSKKKHSLLSRKWLLRLLGTAGAWFILDVVFYGNSVSSVFILRKLDPGSHLVISTLLTALIFLVFAVPGYALAAAYIDRIGRKFLQIFGFLMIGVCYGLIALIPHITGMLAWFVIIFGLSFFFVNFGPNTTTFLIPSEVYPTSLRASAHGLSAALGKVGAFVGAFFLPHVLHLQGMRFTMGMLAIICVIGILLTFLIPEMKGRAITETER